MHPQHQKGRTYGASVHMDAYNMVSLSAQDTLITVILVTSVNWILDVLVTE
jgi:hypothetical protein